MFDVIENLNEEEIKELYESIVAENETNNISCSIFKVTCTNGYAVYLRWETMYYPVNYCKTCGYECGSNFICGAGSRECMVAINSETYCPHITSP